MDPHELYALWETSARREGLMSEISQWSLAASVNFSGAQEGW